MTKKNVKKAIIPANEVVKEINNNEVSSNEIVEDMHIASVLPKTTVIGFDTDDDLLSEINNRISILNRNTFLLKNISKNISRIALKQIIPEMITCRFPATKKGLNVGFVFVQMKSQDLVDKYIEKFNSQLIDDMKVSAQKLKVPEQFTKITDFDLKQLFFNGLKPKTKLSDIKEFYPNAKIIFPTNKDKSAQGSVTLIFNTENDAKEAFAENKLTINGVKVQLNYLIKKNSQEEKEIPGPEVVPKVTNNVEVKEIEPSKKRALVDEDVEAASLKKIKINNVTEEVNLVAPKVGKRKFEETDENPLKKLRSSFIPKIVEGKVVKRTMLENPVEDLSTEFSTIPKINTRKMATVKSETLPPVKKILQIREVNKEKVVQEKVVAKVDSKKETSKVIPKKETSKVIPKKETVTVIPKRESTKVIQKKEISKVEDAKKKVKEEMPKVQILKENDGKKSLIRKPSVKGRK